MSGANDTGDFIGIMANSLCQGQMILAILSAYWRQSVSGANDTDDFIGIMANSLCQGRMILAILLA